MFKILDNKSIYVTRGDIASIEVSAKSHTGEAYVFKVGDVVRLQVFEKGRCNKIVLQKTVEALEECTTLDIFLETGDTRFCEVIHAPKDYWYELTLNPDTRPQTLVGYDDVGPKLFRIFPEGSVEYGR